MNSRRRAIGGGQRLSRVGARSAFTMIEMLCVVTILAIAAAIVFAGMTNEGYIQAKAGARTIVSDLLMAQNVAISTQQNVYVTFNTGSLAYGGVPGQSYGLCSSITGNAVFLTNPMTQQSYDVSWESLQWGVSAVSFNGVTSMGFNSLGVPITSSGSYIPAAGTITVSSGGYNVVITIQANTGDITVQ